MKAATSGRARQQWQICARRLDATTVTRGSVLHLAEQSAQVELGRHQQFNAARFRNVTECNQLTVYL